jgi:uncharacterized protein (TIGR02217 family)
MSYPLITLPAGVTWGYSKSPKYSTIIQTPQSGRGQVRATLQQSPVFEWELTWDYLKENGVTTTNDFQYLLDFYMAMQGSFGGFIFDPSQYNFERLAVTQNLSAFNNGFSGIGDGTTRAFQLWRSSAPISGSNYLLEMIQNVSVLAGIYVNGVLISSGSYTLTNFPSVVTFTTAPAASDTIAWAGNFNYVAHFAEDSNDFEEFMFQLWTLKTLKLESVQL